MATILSPLSEVTKDANEIKEILKKGHIRFFNALSDNLYLINCTNSYIRMDFKNPEAAKDWIGRYFSTFHYITIDDIIH